MRGFFVKEGRLISDSKVCVPAEVLSRVCELVHSYAHVGRKKTELMMARRYEPHCKDTLVDILQKVSDSCHTCQASKSKIGKQAGTRQYHPIPLDIFSSIAIDFVDLPPCTHAGSEFDRAMVIVDRLSGYVIAIPCKKAGMDASQAADLFYFRVASFMGIPKEIMSDKDNLINSSFFTTLCASAGISQATSTAYRPSGNGRAEGAVKAVVSTLRKFLVQQKTVIPKNKKNKDGVNQVTGLERNWVVALPLALWAINEAPGAVSPHSPHQIVFGRDMVGFGEEPNLSIPRPSAEGEEYFEVISKMRADVSQKLNGIHRKELEKFNEKHPRPTEYKFGDKVWVKSRPETLGSKLEFPWVGPCEVISNPHHDTYEVTHPDGHITINQERMKPYVPPFMGKQVPLFYHCPELQIPETENPYNVQEIVKHRTRDGKRQWRVRWEGYGPKDDTWEPVGHFLPNYNKPWLEYNKKKKYLLS
jgi:hypothetical protein